MNINYQNKEIQSITIKEDKKAFKLCLRIKVLNVIQIYIQLQIQNELLE